MYSSMNFNTGYIQVTPTSSKIHNISTPHRVFHVSSVSTSPVGKLLLWPLLPSSFASIKLSNRPKNLLKQGVLASFQSRARAWTRAPEHMENERLPKRTRRLSDPFRGTTRSRGAARRPLRRRRADPKDPCGPFSLSRDIFANKQ